MTEEFHAQTGEDIILSGIFGRQKRGCCLEVGALDGILNSITLHFEELGWDCILIEANPELAAKAAILRKARVFPCAAGQASGTIEMVMARGADYLSTTNPTPAHLARIKEDGGTIERITVPVMRVDEALQSAGVSRLDFASIDVEGAELDVLRGFDLERWKPKVLVIEDNDPKVRGYLCAQGYRCFLHEGFNDWYARSDDAELLTFRRRFAERKRLVRKILFAWTIGLLPVSFQTSIVRRKRKWFGKL